MKTVSEIARSANIGADTIRHYTKIGLLNPKRDDQNGYRYYDQQNEKRLRFILSAKNLGFSLKEIRQILDLSSSGETPCPIVREMIAKHLSVIQRQMRDAQMLFTRMKHASALWQEIPDGDP